MKPATAWTMQHKAPVRAIARSFDHHRTNSSGCDHDPQPLVWTKTVDDIIIKVKRGRATLGSVTESATHH